MNFTLIVRLKAYYMEATKDELLKFLDDQVLTPV